MTTGLVSPEQTFLLLSKYQCPPAPWTSSPDVLQALLCQCKGHLLCEDFPDLSRTDLPTWYLHCSLYTTYHQSSDMVLPNLLTCLPLLTFPAAPWRQGLFLVCL